MVIRNQNLNPPRLAIVGVGLISVCSSLISVGSSLISVGSSLISVGSSLINVGSSLISVGSNLGSRFKSNQVVGSSLSKSGRFKYQQDQVSATAIVLFVEQSLPMPTSLRDSDWAQIEIAIGPVEAIVSYISNFH